MRELKQQPPASPISIANAAMICVNITLLFFILAVLLPVSNCAKVGRCTKLREGSKCRSTHSELELDQGVCIYDELKKPACHKPDSRRFSFKLVAAIRQLTDDTEPIRSLWLRGSGPGLSWERAKEMKRVKDGFWALDINYIYDSNALLCLKSTQCSLNQRSLEFRVHKDDLGREDMLGPNIYIRLPISNSISGHSDFSPPNVFFYPWFDSKRVKVKSHTFSTPLYFHRLNKYMKVSIFYPPSYYHNAWKRYPVVILFGTRAKRQIVPLLESMYVYESNIKEAIVVSVHDQSINPPYCDYNPFELIPETVTGNEATNYRGNYVWRCHSVRYKDCHACMTCFDPNREDSCSVEEFYAESLRCDLHPFRCFARGGSKLDILENNVLPELSLMTAGRIMIDYPKDRISIIGVVD